MEGRQDSAIPFGDIIVLARGQLYSTYNGFKFVQDPYPNDCDDCHNGRIKCSPSQCKGWSPVTGEQLVALWTVKRIRHRDPVYGHRFELEYTLSPISAVVNSRYLLTDGEFDYNIPGHVFIIKTDPTVDKSGFYTTAGTTWFNNNNYVNLDGKKTQTTKANDEEIEIYKELIKSLAMKTSTSLKPVRTSPIYSDIFDATIQKVPVTMIHQQTSPPHKAPSTTTSVWTTPLVDETKPTKYSEPDPLYHSTTGRKTSKPPITTITFFAPDESITENDIFGSPQTTVTTTARGITSGTVHADIFDVAEVSTNIQTQSTAKYSTNTIPEETTVFTTTARSTTTTTPSTESYSKRTAKPSTTASTTRAYSRRTTSTRSASTTTTTTTKPTRRTRKPFVPNRFTRPKPTRRRTTTSAEFEEIFLQKTSTTTRSSTTEELMLTTRSTTPSIFDVSIEEVEKTTTASDVESTVKRKDVATEKSGDEKTTSSGVDGTTEKSTDVEITSKVTLTTKERAEVATSKTTVESSLTTPYREKYTKPVYTTTESANTYEGTVQYGEKHTKPPSTTTTENATKPAVSTKIASTTKENSEKTESMQYSENYTKPQPTTSIPSTTTENLYQTLKTSEKNTKPSVTTKTPSTTEESSERTTKNVYERTETDKTSEKTVITTKIPSITKESSDSEEYSKEYTKPQPTTTAKNVYEKSETGKTSKKYTKTVVTTKIPSTTKESSESEEYSKEYTKPQPTTTIKTVYERNETDKTRENRTKNAVTTTKTHSITEQSSERTKTVKNNKKHTKSPSTSTETTTPIVFVGTIITKKPTTTSQKIKQEDIYDIFGEQAPSAIEKPSTEKQTKTTIADDFLFGSEIKQLPATTQGPVVIFDNFFEASTSSSNETNNKTTQLENNTEGEPLTSMSYITSISFQVNGKNGTQQSASPDTMLKASVKEITTNASDFKVFKAEMPDSNTTKHQFDNIALSLINHARSIDILNKTKAVKQKRRSYTPRRGRRRKVRREKMI